MFKSAFELRSVVERVATVVVIAALLLGSLEYARLAALPTHFV